MPQNIYDIECITFYLVQYFIKRKKKHFTNMVKKKKKVYNNYIHARSFINTELKKQLYMLNYLSYYFIIQYHNYLS